MPTIRPPRVLGAAAAGFALILSVIATADPAWASSAGVDVWNVGELENELKKSEVCKDGLDRRMESMTQAFALNRLLVEELADGERTLPEAVDVYATANRDVAGTMTMLDLDYAGGTVRGRIARYLIDRADRQFGAAARDRLKAQFAAAFPHDPAPRS